MIMQHPALHPLGGRLRNRGRAGPSIGALAVENLARRRQEVGQALLVLAELCLGPRVERLRPMRLDLGMVMVAL